MTKLYNINSFMSCLIRKANQNMTYLCCMFDAEIGLSMEDI